MSDHPNEAGLLGWLDSPRLVMGSATLFLFALLGFMLLLWDDRGKQVARIDAVVQAHELDEQTTNRETVERCFSAANQGPALRKVLSALEMEMMNPEGRQALRNWRRLNQLNAPTLRECRQLALKLNVQVARGNQ